MNDMTVSSISKTPTWSSASENNACYKCTECLEAKDKSGFFNKQWKRKGKGVCKICWGAQMKKHGEEIKAEGRKTLELEYTCDKCSRQCTAIMKKSQTKTPTTCRPCVKGIEQKERLDAENKRKQEWLDRENAEKKVAVEWTCPSCQTPSVISLFEKNRRIECVNCVEAKERARKAADTSEYLLEYGVGYEDVEVDTLSFKKEPLVNESLLGTYKLIYYSSDNDGCDNKVEEIHRTARGKLEFSLKTWDEKPALFGRYDIGTNMPDASFESDSDNWGETLSATFIEHVTEWDATEVLCNGFNIFRHSRDNDDGKEKKLFVMARGEDGHQEENWWGDLLAVEHFEELGRWDMFCGAKLRILNQSLALGVSADKLSEVDYSPTGRRVEVANKPDNLNEAKKLMERYRDGNNAWTCKHLDLPSSVAFLVREYVTPAPVFYLRPGDLILEVEESMHPEWNKLLVFRQEA